jgi:hypothetical protein
MTDRIHRGGLPAQILGKEFHAYALDLDEDTDTDPEGVFEPSESALAAMARKTLIRAGIYEPTAKQIADARESAKLEYAAQAEYALKTGKVLS